MSSKRSTSAKCYVVTSGSKDLARVTVQTRTHPVDNPPTVQYERGARVIVGAFLETDTYPQLRCCYCGHQRRLHDLKQRGRAGAGTRTGNLQRWAQPNRYVGNPQFNFGQNGNRCGHCTRWRVLPRQGAEVRSQGGGWKQDRLQVCLGGPQASMRFALGHLWATREQLRPLPISNSSCGAEVYHGNRQSGRSLVTPTEADAQHL